MRCCHVRTVILLPEQVRRLRRRQNLLRALVGAAHNHRYGIVPPAEHDLVAVGALLLAGLGREQYARVIHTRRRERKVKVRILFRDPLVVVVPVLAVGRWRGENRVAWGSSSRVA